MKTFETSAEALALLGLLKDFDPVRLTETVTKLGEDWAIAKAAASSLEESKKSVLARIQLDFMEQGIPGKVGERPKPMPAVQAELRALCDAGYEMHLDLMISNRKEADIARVRYDQGQMKLELMRSLQATLRQEMRFAGLQT